MPYAKWKETFAYTGTLVSNGNWTESLVTVDSPLVTSGLVVTQPVNAPSAGVTAAENDIDVATLNFSAADYGFATALAYGTLDSANENETLSVLLGDPSATATLFQLSLLPGSVGEIDIGDLNGSTTPITPASATPANIIYRQHAGIVTTIIDGVQSGTTAAITQAGTTPPVITLYLTTNLAAPPQKLVSLIFVQGTTPVATGLTAGTPTASAVPLSWTKPADVGGVVVAEYYNIYTSADNVTFTLNKTAAGTSTTVSGLASNTLYYFKVAVFDGVYESAKTAVASATTAKAPPSAGIVPAGHWLPWLCTI